MIYCYVNEKSRYIYKKKKKIFRLEIKMVLTIELAKCPQLNTRPNVPNLWCLASSITFLAYSYKNVSGKKKLVKISFYSWNYQKMDRCQKLILSLFIFFGNEKVWPQMILEKVVCIYKNFIALILSIQCGLNAIAVK